MLGGVMNTSRHWTSRIGLIAAVVAIAAFYFAGDTKKAPAQKEEKDVRSLEGKPAPDLTLNTLDGKQFKLSALKGSVVLMDYWATWCPPCRKSLPHINTISQDKELAAKGLKVFAINDKEKKPEVEQFVKQNNYSFTVPLDVQGKFGQLYLVRGIPTTVLVGRDGNIKKVFVGFGDGSEEGIKQAINEALDDKGPTS